MMTRIMNDLRKDIAVNVHVNFETFPLSRSAALTV